MSLFTTATGRGLRVNAGTRLSAGSARATPNGKGMSAFSVTRPGKLGMESSKGGDQRTLILQYMHVLMFMT